MPKLNELLETKSRKEQEKRVEQLLQAFNSPVIDLVIRFDPRIDGVSVTVIGGDVTFRTIYHMLDSARDIIREREIKASIDQQGMQPDAPPQHPDQPAEDNGEPFPEMNAPEVAAE